MGPVKYKLKMPFKSLDEQKLRSLGGEGDIYITNRLIGSSILPTLKKWQTQWIFWFKTIKQNGVQWTNIWKWWSGLSKYETEWCIQLIIHK